MNNIKIDTKINLIGNQNHKQFLELQSTFGIAQRGGAIIPTFSINHTKRIVSDVNLLSNKEVKQLIFNETIYSN